MPENKEAEGKYVKVEGFMFTRETYEAMKKVEMLPPELRKAVYSLIDDLF